MGMLYGGSIYSFRRGDNTMAVVCPLKRPPPVLYTRPKNVSHLNPPRKGDLVVIIEDYEKTYGRIIWVDRANDAAGVLMFASDELETFDMSTFDSVDEMSGKLRWRVER
jgi:hypothetical protein